MELPAVKTEVTIQDMATAFYRAYYSFLRSHPKPESVKILLSHWALETGWGKSMWCYNVGNAKSTGVSGDWCFFKCNEILRTKSAEFQVARDPNLAKITTRRANSCIVWFYPKHPYTRFRAFKTLEEGVYDHLKMLVRTFTLAWPFVVAGDPVAYSKALKRQKYYTADEAQYTKVLRSVYSKFDKIELPIRPMFSEGEKEQMRNEVCLSLRAMSAEALEAVILEE